MKSENNCHSCITKSAILKIIRRAGTWYCDDMYASQRLKAKDARPGSVSRRIVGAINTIAKAKEETNE